MSVGSIWEYSIIDRRSNVEVQNAKMITRIESSEVINSNKYFKSISVFDGLPGAEPEITYCRKSDSGIMCIDHKFMDKGEFLVQPTKVEVGLSWVSDYPTGPVNCKVEKMEDLYLYEKTYPNCMKILFDGVYNGNKYGGYYYLAENIGQVKKVFLIEQSITADFTLTHYQN
jgi:hypothetical protein